VRLIAIIGRTAVKDRHAGFHGNHPCLISAIARPGSTAFKNPVSNLARDGHVTCCGQQWNHSKPRRRPFSFEARAKHTASPCTHLVQFADQDRLVRYVTPIKCRTSGASGKSASVLKAGKPQQVFWGWNGPNMQSTLKPIFLVCSMRNSHHGHRHPTTAMDRGRRRRFKNHSYAVVLCAKGAAIDHAE